jgi:Flp pilus assembly protein TadD
LAYIYFHHFHHISIILFPSFQVEVHVHEEPGANNKTQFLEKVRLSNEAIQNGDFKRAIQLYSDTISLDPLNHILYSNRSAAYIKVNQFKKGLQDALKARELNPQWAKVRESDYVNSK